MAEYDSDVEGEGNDSSDMMSLFASYYNLEGEQKGGDGTDNNTSNISTAVAAGGSSSTTKGAAEAVNRNTSSASSTSIDSSNFNPGIYVENMLETVRADELLFKNVQLVHDIRSLDSDMQMLVYENYNKFIAATETIKRMKSNVEAMDTDMYNVKSKMDLIDNKAATLDGSLNAKNSRVEKLVRVQRLLKRLEFLTELPERLTGMIDRGDYDAAVQLYKNTNHVLTQYGHVLSFKNIQKSADAMMSSLGTRIINGLDDPNLDSAQLTRFISILVSMKSPRELIADKMLSAHRHRSLHIVKMFSASINNNEITQVIGSDIDKFNTNTNTNTNTSSSDSSSTSSRSPSSSVAKSRQFHQILVVGLIEACKGLVELYGIKEEIQTVPEPVQGKTPNEVVEQPQATSLNNATVIVTSTATVHSSLQALNVLVCSIMAEVSKCITTVMREFFGTYSQYVSSHQALCAAEAEAGGQRQAQGQEGKRGDLEGNSRNSTVHASQVRFYELDDEKMAWIVFAQQSIAEAVFLDAALLDATTRIHQAYPISSCSNVNNASGSTDTSVGAGRNRNSPVKKGREGGDRWGRSSSSSSSSSSTTTLSLEFTRNVMNVLLEHVNQARTRRLNNFTSTFKKIVKMEVLMPLNATSLLRQTSGADINTGTDTDKEEETGCFSIDSTAVSHLSHLSREIPSILERLGEEFFSTFADVVADTQAILDVTATLPPELLMLLKSTSTHTDIDLGSVTLSDITSLPLSFCQQITTHLLEECTSISASNGNGTSNNSDERMAMMQRKQNYDVYTEHWPPVSVPVNAIVSQTLITEQHPHPVTTTSTIEDDNTTPTSPTSISKHIYSLVAAALLQQLSEGTANRLLLEVCESHDIPSKIYSHTRSHNRFDTDTGTGEGTGIGDRTSHSRSRLSHTSMSSTGSGSDYGNGHDSAFASPPSTTLIRDRITSLLSDSAHTLLLAVMENISLTTSQLFCSQVTHFALPGITTNSKEHETEEREREREREREGSKLFVSANTLHVCCQLASLVSASCLVLGDTLPNTCSRRLNMIDIKKTLPSYRSNVNGSRNTCNTMTVEQLRIERLFAQPVQVFTLPFSIKSIYDQQTDAAAGAGTKTRLGIGRGNHVSAWQSSIDSIHKGEGGGAAAERGSILGPMATTDGEVPITVAKAMLKNMIEQIRLRLLPIHVQAQLHVDLMYFKMVCNTLFATGTGAEVGVLLDQVGNTLRERQAAM